MNGSMVHYVVAPSRKDIVTFITLDGLFDATDTSDGMLIEHMLRLEALATFVAHEPLDTFVNRLFVISKLTIEQKLQVTFIALELMLVFFMHNFNMSLQILESMR